MLIYLLYYTISCTYYLYKPMDGLHWMGWNVNTLTGNFYSYIDWAYETGDLYPSDECNLSLLYHQICPPNSLSNSSNVSNLFWYTNSNFKLLKFASATALS